MQLVIPPYLQPGDTIGIVCPAGYMPVEKAKTCLETLQEWGFHVKTGNTLGGNSTNYFSGNDEERLYDLQQMLDDDMVQAVLCGRGGYGMGRIIEQIDFKKFSKRPKWIIGYSDITVLHSHVYANYHVAALHSPMVSAFNDGGAESKSVLSLKHLLTGGQAEYTCNPHPYNKTGKAEGALVGGNLSLIAHLTGTSSDIKTKGKILFLEDVGEYIYNVDRMFWHLKRNGKLDKLAGLIIGGFTDMQDTDRPYGKQVYDIIHEMLSEYDYPICFGFPVSHAEENYALKTGVPHRLVIGKDEVVLKEII